MVKHWCLPLLTAERSSETKMKTAVLVLFIGLVAVSNALEKARAKRGWRRFTGSIEQVAEAAKEPAREVSCAAMSAARKTCLAAVPTNKLDAAAKDVKAAQAKCKSSYTVGIYVDRELIGESPGETI